MNAISGDGPVESSCRIALVLGGGNALGAYQAGLYQALEEGHLEPDWIVGTSIGAVNGAILAGNPREARLEKLEALWRPGDEAGWPVPWDLVPESWRRTNAVLATMVGGRRGMFGPLGSSWMRGPAGGSPALYDSQMLHDTLLELVDFERLNRLTPRFSALAVDVESGEEVLFDSTKQRISADHIRASAALLTTFPAIEVDGRLMGDGGLSQNLALDPVFAEAGAIPTLCIAADLLPLHAPRPHTVGEAMSRMQDLLFAAQSRRTIARWQAALPPDGASITLVRLTYAAQDQEVAGKAMDFSPRSVRLRWNAGYEDGSNLLERLAADDIRPGEPGLVVHEHGGRGCRRRRVEA